MILQVLLDSGECIVPWLQRVLFPGVCWNRVQLEKSGERPAGVDVGQRDSLGKEQVAEGLQSEIRA